MSGWLDTTKRVRPTENAISGFAPKVLEKRQRSLCVRFEPVKAKSRPRRGSPEGPGMAALRCDVRYLERAQARPPGERKMEIAEIRMRRQRKVLELMISEDDENPGWGMNRKQDSQYDIFHFLERERERERGL